MLAAFARAAGDLVVEDIAAPEVRHGDVLIRVRAAGICGSDLHFHRGTGTNPQLRFAGGHEVSGTVLASTADGPAVGASVAVEPLVPCGTCQQCSSGHQQLCRHLKHLAIGFAEFAAVPRRNVHLLPRGLTVEQGAIADVVAVALHALRRVPPDEGGTAVVIGDGPMGLVVSRLIALRRARWLGMVGSHPHTLALARRWGTDHTELHGDVGIARAMWEATSEIGASIVYECVGGTGSSLDLAVRLVRPGGTVAVLGGFPSPSRADLKEPLRKEVTLRFCYSYGRHNDRSEFAEALDLIADGSVPVADMVTHRFSLTEIQRGFDAALHKGASKAVKVLVVGG